MKVAHIGATGKVGGKILEELLLWLTSSKGRSIFACASPSDIDFPDQLRRELINH